MYAFNFIHGDLEQVWIPIQKRLAPLKYIKFRVV